MIKTSFAASTKTTREEQRTGGSAQRMETEADGDNQVNEMDVSSLENSYNRDKNNICL